MSQYNMSPLPDLQTGGTLEEIYQNQKTIKNWLFQLNEQLRYNLYNMETENFTQATVDQLTSVSDDVKAQLQVLNGKITAAVTAADGRFASLEIDIDGITASVGDMQGNISQLQQTATSISATVAGIDGDVAQLQIQANQIESTVEDVEGNLSSVQQTADKINWVVSSGTSASNFTLTSHMASLIADQVEIATDSLQISSISYNSSCYVNCQAREVQIYCGSGPVSLGSPSYGADVDGPLTCYGTIYCETNNALVGSGNIVIDNFQLAAYSGKFEGWCYAPSWNNGSDRSLKENIQDLDEVKSRALILGLKPVSYYYKPTTETLRAQTRPYTLEAAAPATPGSIQEDVSNSTLPENILHFGFIAQDVQEELVSAGWTEGNPLVSSRKLRETDETETLMLNYTDIIAPLVKTVQWMEARITALEGDTA